MVVQRCCSRPHWGQYVHCTPLLLPIPTSAPAGLATPAGTALRQGAGAATVSSAASTPRRPDLGIHIGTRGGGERRGELLYEGSPLRAAARSPNAAGLLTFGSKYMPFAAGRWGAGAGVP